MQVDFRSNGGWSRLVGTLLALFVALVLGGSFYITYRFTSRFAGALDHEVVSHADEIFFKEHDGKKVTLRSQDGISLAGVLIQRKDAKGHVILCHGYQRTKERMASYCTFFPNYTILAFDFRACGESGGTSSSIGAHEYKDIIAAATYLKELEGCGPCVVLGASMGASAALKAAHMRPDLFDGVIADSAYACLYEEIAHIFSTKTGVPYYPFFQAAVQMFYYLFGDEARTMRPLDFVAASRMPLLFVHSSTDTFTLPEHSVKLYAHASKNNVRARLWIGPPARHTWLVKHYEDSYRSKVKKFLARAEAWHAAHTPA